MKWLHNTWWPYHSTRDARKKFKVKVSKFIVLHVKVLKVLKVKKRKQSVWPHVERLAKYLKVEVSIF